LRGRILSFEMMCIVLKEERMRIVLKRRMRIVLKGRMRIVLNQEKMDLRINRILLIVLSFLSWFRQPNCPAPPFSFLSWCKTKLLWFKQEGKVVLNQEKKDLRINRILLIFLSFLSWFRQRSYI